MEKDISASFPIGIIIFISMMKTNLPTGTCISCQWNSQLLQPALLRQ